MKPKDNFRLPGPLFLSVPGLMLLLISSLTMAPQYSQAANDAPFGVMLNLPNYPNSNGDDYLMALQDVRATGNHSGFIWHWDKQESLPDRIRDIRYLKEIGLTTIAQISVAVLGEPNPPPGYVRSFSDPETKALYLSNVQTLAQAQPDYLILATEANFMKYWMPEEWTAFIDAYQEAAQIVHRLAPLTKIGVSLHYGMFIWQQDAPMLEQLGDCDFAAFTSYPGWLLMDGYYSSIEEIPPDWYAMVRLYFPDLPIIFSEVGWSSGGMSNEEEQRRYIENLPRLMSLARPDMICYVFAYDVDYFKQEWIDLMSDKEKQLLDELGVDLSLLFNRFNNMGLKYVDGSPKPAWEAALQVNETFSLATAPL